MMPLYIELVDRSTLATLPAVGAEVVSVWISEGTSDTFRLVDTPDEHEAPPTPERAARILYC